MSSGFEYTEAQDHKGSKHIFQPRYSSVSQQVQQPQQQKFQKLTFNSAAAYGTTTSQGRMVGGTTAVQRRQQQQQQQLMQKSMQQQQQRKTTAGGGTDMQIGPDQQKVTILNYFLRSFRSARALYNEKNILIHLGTVTFTKSYFDVIRYR